MRACFLGTCKCFLVCLIGNLKQSGPKPNELVGSNQSRDKKLDRFFKSKKNSVKTKQSSLLSAGQYRHLARGDGFPLDPNKFARF